MSLSVKRKSSLGQTLIEYTVIIPVFIIFICTAVEVSFMFITSQRVGSISRELASGGFRDCLGLQPDDAEDCKEKLLDNIKKSSDVLLNNFFSTDKNGIQKGRIMLSFFLSPIAQPERIVFPNPLPTGTNSKFNTSDAAIKSILQMNTPVVTGEVWYHYEAITPFGKILGIVFPQRIDFYDATVY